MFVIGVASSLILNIRVIIDATGIKTRKKQTEENTAATKKAIHEIRMDVKDLQNTLEDLVRKNKKDMTATIRSTIWHMHRTLMDQGYVTPDALKTFKELGNVYEANGGNDIYHDILLPDIKELEIRYPDNRKEDK